MAFVAEARGVEVVKIDELHREISPLRDLVAVFRLARLIRAERPQILHTHTAKAGAIGRARRARRGPGTGRRSSSTPSTATSCTATSTRSAHGSSGCSSAFSRAPRRR